MSSAEFEEWLAKLCLRFAKNDPTLTEVELDNGNHMLGDFHMLALTDAFRKNRTVTKFCLRNMRISIQSAFLLVPALKNNTKLSTLSIEECEDNDGHLLNALTVALFYNRSIQTLYLRGCWTATSAAFSLGSLVEAASHLTEICICHNQIDLQTAKALKCGLLYNKSIQTLDLTGNNMDCRAVQEVAVGMSGNESVEYLTLDFNCFGDEGVWALSNMLTVNDSLKELSLFSNRISSKGAEHLAEALNTNSRLESLILSFNQIGDRGVAALAQALTVNTTLAKMWFPSNAITNEGMQAFADHLPKMNGLEQLNVGLLLDDDAANALVKALKYNLRLSVLYMEKPFVFDEDCNNNDLDFYLRLNRSGRRFIRDAQISPALWPYILARSTQNMNEKGTPDVLHYMLRAKPELLVQRKQFFESGA